MLKILKYSLKEYKWVYIAEALGIIAFTIGTNLSEDINIKVITSFLSIVMFVNFIMQIMLFSFQLSTERGRMLFMAPIKGKSFFVSKVVEFFAANTFIILSGVFILAISSLGNNELSSGLLRFIYENFGNMLKLSTIYFIIISLITLVGSITNNGLVVVLSSIIGNLIITLGLGKLNHLCNIWFEDYIYKVSYNDSTKVFYSVGDIMNSSLNLVYIGLTIIIIGGLIYFSSKILDKKLDII
ncbi:hypothetical protein [Clostridium hydrogeniformans]|uniref:hypothetical protein n=1 Tax=Clostridium hydrogeniformans TaxID=349933 RepID=UPI000488D5AC|nr:hypothetical protein [Clostridium hydrogeniformans]